MSIKSKWIVLLLAIMLVPSVALAESPWAAEDSYGAQTRQKLDYGVKNALGGWTEIITAPVSTFKEGGSFKELVESQFTGLYDAVIYTVGGALHLGTFFLPLDVEIPENGVQFE